jgi:gliding motility-associated-like protein
MHILRTYILISSILCVIHSGYSQCPFAVSLKSTGNCLGDTLMVSTTYALTQIVWLKGGVVEKDGRNIPSDTLYRPAEPGSYTAAVSNSDGCTVTVGPFEIKAPDNTSALPLRIASSTPVICSGMPASFNATASSESSLAYQWQVNGTNEGGNSSLFTSSSLSDGDLITCILINTNSCTANTSNSISIVIEPSPHIEAATPVSLLLGQSVVLQPVINGNIASYLWSPATGLSDDHIADPVAMPLKSTIYTLKVATAKGCRTSGQVEVEVFSSIKIPDAFTPNSDGRNDIFYIMGNPQGSTIKEFSIFSRLGQRVFQRMDVPPGDPAYGWNGYYNGSAAPVGAYVYSVIIRLADGSRRIFGGTVVLVR